MKNCPTCNAELSEGYCEQCDLTYTETQGRVKAKAGDGRLKRLEENQARTDDKLQKMHDAIFGEDDSEIW